MRLDAGLDSPVCAAVGGPPGLVRACPGVWPEGRGGEWSSILVLLLLPPPPLQSAVEAVVLRMALAGGD